MKISEIYSEMQRLRLVETKDDFSTSWLCRHWSYYSQMGERVSVDVLLSLWENLQASGQTDLAVRVFQLIREKTRKEPAQSRADYGKADAT